MLGKAIKIASEMFVDVKDKGGNPYILHCLKVMELCNSNSIDVKCAAVLHDIIEDTNYTDVMLIEEGFSQRTVDIIKILTHTNDMSYIEYIERIATDKDALEIKLADLRHNSDITRIKGLKEKDFDRIKKYHNAYTYLINKKY